VAATHTLEILSDALNAALVAGDFATTENPRAWIKADNRLLDACIDAGMDRDHADHRAWAAEAVVAWLSSADYDEDYCDCGATINGADGGLCGACRGEYRAEMAHMLEAA
jgi:hypothetical protein